MLWTTEGFARESSARHSNPGAPADAELDEVVRAARHPLGAWRVLRAIREFKKLPEAAKFEVLAKIKDLEKAHQAYVARAAASVNPPTPQPEEESARVAREARATYLRTGRNPLASGLVDRNGRPLRRD